MQKVTRFLSYVLVAVLASVLTLAATDVGETASQSKLDQLSNLIQERFIGEADVTAMEDAAADAMVEALGDRWSYYIAAEDYQNYWEQMENSYVGIGVTVIMVDEGYEIQKVTEGGPALEAGLLPGDIITHVSGESVAELGSTEATNRIKGEEGTTVELTVQRAGETMTFTVERRTIQTVVAKGIMLEGNVGLVTIANFDERCADETIAAVESLIEEGAQALIFDVRNNPGGYVSELVEVLDYLLPEGDLFRSVYYDGREAVETSDASCIDLPMAVLVNGGSYSAAEFFAAAIREYEAGIVVGSQTCGKGYFQTVIKLKDGSAVGLSVGKYFTPKGVSLAEVGGLTPDIEVEIEDATFAAIYAGTLDPSEDPQIQAAWEALTGE